MMEYARAGDPAQFCITARPDSVTGGPGWRLAMFILLPGSGLIGAFFLAQGIWPVALTLSLPVLGLIRACRELERHAGDFERLTLEADRLLLDCHSPAGDTHLEFNSHWVQVALRRSAVGGGMTLTLRSHGREAIFGRLLSDEERAAVGRELKRRLARIRH